MTPDPRFFENSGPATLRELADLTGARLLDAAASEVCIDGVAVISHGRAGAVTFLSDPRMAASFGGAPPAACFLREADRNLAPPGCVALITATPHGAYAIAAERLHQPKQLSDRAVAADVQLEEGVHLAAGVVLGPGVQIGQGSSIGANTVVGPGVAIGRDCRIGANVTIGCALIGDRVRILSGAVIGEPGFGATAGPKGVVDVPQLGRVILQDGVTVGANTTIDRGAFEDTVIGENTKIDNQVQIAHNVRIGRNCVMAAQVGIAGSVVIGDGVAFGGGAGVADHITIGDGARVAAAAGVMRDIAPGETVGGAPARPILTFMRETAWLARMAGRRQGAQE